MAQGLKRGDLFLVALPGDYGKPRPAVIVQDMSEGPAASIIVCPCTSMLIAAGPVRPLIQPDPENGLRVPSQVMVDKINVVASSKAKPAIGSLAAKDMHAVDKALAKLLRLSTRSNER